MYTAAGLQNFLAHLTAPMEQNDVTPPLRFEAAGRLCAALSNGGYTYLALECPANFEIVKATCNMGVLVLERGADGTAPRYFPMGSCLRFIMAHAAIQDTIEQHQWCPQGCTKVSILQGATLPNPQLNQPYYHRIILSGTPPFRLGAVLGAPPWMTLVIDAGELRISGTPNQLGTFRLEIPMYSCGELSPLVTQCLEVQP